MEFVRKVIVWIFSIFVVLGISPRTVPATVKLEEIDPENAVVSVGDFTLGYSNGSFSLAFSDVTVFSDATSEFIAEDRLISSAKYDSFSIETNDVSDARGNGKAVTVTLTDETLPTLKQHFTFYDGERYMLTQLEIIGRNGEAASNYIAPVVVKDKKLQNGNPRWTNFLEVPFDNDNWATFETKYLFESGLSHEVGAFFTPDNEDGFIIGSVTEMIFCSLLVELRKK